MSRFFNAVLRIMAGICAFLFVVTAGIALLLFNAERRLFNAQLYIHALDSQNFYERLPELVSEAVTTVANLNPCDTNPVMCASEGRPPEAQTCLEEALGAETYQALVQNQRAPTPEEISRIQPCLDQFPQVPSEEQSQGGPPSFLKALSAEDWQAIIRAILPPDLSRSMTEQALTSIFDTLNGRSETATLSLVEFKARLAGPDSVQALMQLMRAQPPCTPKQIAQMTIGSLTGGSGELVLCSLPEEMLTLAQPFLKNEIQVAAAGIPDTVTILSLSKVEQNPLQALRAARAVMRLSPLLPLGLLFLVTIFAVRDLKGWLDWWGIPLLLSGLLGLALAASVNPIFQWAFKTRFSPRFLPGFPPLLVETVRGIMGSVVSGIAAPILFQSIVLALLGVVMILATRIRKPVTPPSEPRDHFGEAPGERTQS